MLRDQCSSVLPLSASRRADCMTAIEIWYFISTVRVYVKSYTIVCHVRHKLSAEISPFAIPSDWATKVPSSEKNAQNCALLIADKVFVSLSVYRSLCFHRCRPFRHRFPRHVCVSLMYFSDAHWSWTAWAAGYVTYAQFEFHPNHFDSDLRRSPGHFWHLFPAFAFVIAALRETQRY